MNLFLDDRAEPLELQRIPLKDRAFVFANTKKVRDNNYLIVLGEASRFSTDNGREAISRFAITETINRLGRTIHELIAKSWGFGTTRWTKLATKTDGSRDFEQSNAVEFISRLNILQRALVSGLGGNKRITDTAGFDSRTLSKAIDVVITPTYK